MGRSPLFESKSKSKMLTVSPQTLEAIEIYMFENRIASFSVAVDTLCRQALDKAKPIASRTRSLTQPVAPVTLQPSASPWDLDNFRMEHPHHVVLGLTGQPGLRHLPEGWPSGSVLRDIIAQPHLWDVRATTFARLSQEQFSSARIEMAIRVCAELPSSKAAIFDFMGLLCADRDYMLANFDRTDDPVNEFNEVLRRLPLYIAATR